MKKGILQKISSVGIAIILALLIIGGWSSASFKQVPKVPQVEATGDEVLVGTLDILHVNEKDKSKKTDYVYILSTANEKYQINFKGKIPLITSGSRVRLHGKKIKDTFEVSQTTSTGAEILSTPTTPSVSGVKKVAVILFNFQNDTRQTYTIDEIRQIGFTGSSSTKAYYQEVSYNNLVLQGIDNVNGDIFGWYTIPFDNTNCNTNYLSNWMQAARNAAINDGHDLTNYDNFAFVWPALDTCNLFSGSFINGHNSYYNGAFNNWSFAHELGHNYGLYHPYGLNCIDANGQRTPMSSSCTVDEYADPFDAMGSGFYHFSNYTKAKFGWLTQNNIQTITASGTYSLHPIEQASNQVQIIQIPRIGRQDYFYLEYRQPYGFDNFAPGEQVANGILIRVAPAITNSSSFTKLVDNTPLTSSFWDSSLMSGRTFLDPITGTTITTISNSPTEAIVNIVLGTYTPSPTPTLVPESLVYADITGANGWLINNEDGAVVNLNDTTYHHTGTSSMSTSYQTSGTGILQMVNEGAIITSYYHLLSFYINGGTSSGQNINIDFWDWNNNLLAQKPLAPYIQGGAVVTNEWRQVLVPFSDFNVGTGSILRYRLVNAVPNTNQPAFYTDDIQMACKGDANGDQIINIQDMNILKSEFGACSSNCKSDFDNNGRVDAADFNTVKTNFGHACPTYY